MFTQVQKTGKENEVFEEKQERNVKRVRSLMMNKRKRYLMKLKIS